MIRREEQVVYETRGETLVIRVGGEVDHHSAVGVRTAIDARISSERPSRVLLELSGVDFMDSSGLGLIMGRFALVQKYHASFAVLDPSPAVLKIIRLAGMEKMITILKTKEKNT